MTMTQEQLIAELKKRGVELEVHSCGCCPPSVRIKFDGKQVEGYFDDFDFED